MKHTHAEAALAKLRYFFRSSAPPWIVYYSGHGEEETGDWITDKRMLGGGLPRGTAHARQSAYCRAECTLQRLHVLHSILHLLPES